LVVDDDARLRELLAEYLGARGYAVETREDAQSGLDRVRQGQVDLVILDLTLPDKDGLEVCRDIRKTSSVPIVMLTARGDETDRIVGLELGADDYLPKPFNPRELLARVQAVLRRTEIAASDPEVLIAGDLRLDLDRREARLHESVLDLTTTEFEILRTLVAQAGRVVPRERLMSMSRGDEFAAFDRSVDVHISHLRRKLGDDPKEPVYIKTVRGVGYVMPRDPR
jgi:DNA-binding response OmpR family regulator